MAFQDRDDHNNNLKAYKNIFLILDERDQETKIAMQLKSENIASCMIEIY